ncbi:PTTG1 interacting protein a [Danio aesculapii]|uniref:PTTG1 interacting protein a n=1 Tax=Danio aesculapii TaxID=1142201 RepID=UPI0024C01704|nr:PTTG1 interacting protein a [Danio aesculapii]
MNFAPPVFLLLVVLCSTLAQNTTLSTSTTTQSSPQTLTTQSAGQPSATTGSSTTPSSTTTTQSSTTTTQTTTQTTTIPTTPHPSCESKNGSCEECLAYVDCLWCWTTKRCITYPAKSILPPHSLCPLNDARWGLCSMNFQVLIITLSVAAALLIIGFLVCIFCCCKCENIGSSRNENRFNRRVDKTKTKQEQRKAEMKIRHDEIRQKYGLSRASPYARFDNPN